jgi:hypothetical protein
MAAEDIGKVAYGIFKTGQQYVGKTVGITGENLTFAEISDKLSKAFGVRVEYNAADADTFRSFGFPGADELGNMFQIYRDFEPRFSAREAPARRGRSTPRCRPSISGSRRTRAAFNCEESTMKYFAIVAAAGDSVALASPDTRPDLRSDRRVDPQYVVHGQAQHHRISEPDVRGRLRIQTGRHGPQLR